MPVRRNSTRPQIIQKLQAPELPKVLSEAEKIAAIEKRLEVLISEKDAAVQKATIEANIMVARVQTEYDARISELNTILVTLRPPAASE